MLIVLVLCNFVWAILVITIIQVIYSGNKISLVSADKNIDEAFSLAARLKIMSGI